MALQDTDLLYVDRGGTLYQVTWQEIRTRQLATTDLLLINRGGNEYQVPIGDFWNCIAVSQAFDFFLVERNSKFYREEILFPCTVQFSVSGATATTVFLAAAPDVTGEPAYIENPDGTKTFLTTTPTAYTLTQNGTYSLAGSFTAVQFTGSDGSVDAGLTPSNVWSNVFAGVSDFGSGLFKNINLLTGIPSGLALDSLDRTFENTSPATTNLSTIDTSAVTSAVGTFLNSDIDATDDVSTWDVANVTNMSRMFDRARVFNSAISGWDISNVTDMSAFLRGAEFFDQDLSAWAVPIIGVSNMASMFDGAIQFNRDLSLWDVSLMEDADYMFRNAHNFNQDLGDWDVSSMRQAAEMFKDANTFQQDLSEWCVNAIPTEPTDFKTGSALLPAGEPVWGTCPKVRCGEMYWTTGGTSIKMEGTISQAANIADPNGSETTIGPGNWTYTGFAKGTYILPVDYITRLSFIDNAFAEFDFAPCFYTGNINNMSRMFDNCKKFKGDVSNWDTSQVTNMSLMFNLNFGFNSPISAWNMSKVENMSNMFRYALVFNQPVGTWDVSATKDMSNMFFNANNFSQNISGWNTGSATNMAWMFQGADLFNQDLNTWNTTNVKNMSNMFRDTFKFNGNIGAWDTSNVTDTSNMFRGSNTFNQDITGWDTSKSRTFQNMFNNARRFNQDINGWDTANVTNMREMFNNAAAFNQDLPDWEVLAVTSRGFDLMFKNATNMNGDLSNWCVPSIFSTPSQFNQDSGFEANTAIQPQWGTCPVTAPTGLIVNNFNGDQLWVRLQFISSTQKGEVVKPDSTVIEVSHAEVWQADQLGQYELPMGIVRSMSFHNSSTTQQLAQNVDYTFEEGFYTKSLTSVQQTFANSRGFNGNITNWDVSNVTSGYRAFINAYSFNGDLSGWNTAKFRTMYEMFGNSLAFNGDISNWNTSKTSNMANMFRNAIAFNRDLSTWNTSNLEVARDMFRDASVFNQYLNPWDVSNVGASNFTNMFENATAMNGDISNWCVTQTSSRPSKFDDGAAFNGDTSLLPDWGTCRAFNGIYLRELVGGTGDLVIGGVAADATVQIRKPDGTFTNPGAGTFANKYTDLGWYEIKNMESLTGLRFFDNDLLFDDTSETAKFYFDERFDTSNLNEFRQMFREADVFDGDISMFDTTNATNMAGMFRNNAAFDGGLSHFDTSNVDNMANMFRGATAFNQDISGWAVYNVTCMSDMFLEATAFRKDISTWCVSGIGSEPTDFDTNAGFDGETAIQPQWGTCPGVVTVTTPPVIAQVNNTDPAPYSENLEIRTAAVVNPAGTAIKGYQWQRSADGTTGWTDIPDYESPATNATYEVSGYDRAQFLRVVVTYDGGTTPDVSTESNALEVVNVQPPVQSLLTETNSQAYTAYANLGENVYGQDYFGASLLASDGVTVINYLRAPYPDSYLLADQLVMPILKFNTQTQIVDTSTELDATVFGSYSPTNRFDMFHGGTIVPDGRHLIAPTQTQNWLLYDYINDIPTLIPDPITRNDRVYGSVIWSSVTNKAYGIPYSRDEITEVDIAAGTVTKMGVGGTEATSISLGWSASCEGPNGRIYLFPGWSTRISEYDPATNILRDLPTPIASNRIWQPGGREFVCAQAIYVDTANAIYGAPSAMLDFIKLDFNNLDGNGSPTPSAIPTGMTRTQTSSYKTYTYSGGLARTEDGIVISVPSGAENSASPTASSYWLSPMFFLDTATDTVTQEPNPFPQIRYISQLRGVITNVNGVITTGLITSFSNIGGQDDYNIPIINTFSTPTSWDPKDPLFNHHN